MKIRAFLTFALLVCCILPASLSAASKEMIELQRDVAQLQDQMRNLQSSFDSKMAELKVLAGQTEEATKGTSSALTGVAAENQRVISQSVVGPMSTLGTRVDGVATDVQGLRENVGELTARIEKMQLVMNDIKTALQAMQTPVAAPPVVQPNGSPAGAAGAAASDAGAPPAGMNPSTLYDSARRDMSGGKLDLAMSEFEDYLKFFGQTDLAPNAQFYIGQIHYSRTEMSDAIAAFDAVLEKYPANTKTPDAHFMKGKALMSIGQRTKAAKEFQTVVDEFPSSSVAEGARAQMKALGLHAAPPPRKR